MTSGAASSGTGRMSMVELARSAHIHERLRYVESLLGLMEGRDDREQHALTGGASMWIGAIDKALESENPHVGRGRYEQRRDHEPGGQTIVGLRLARNEIAHGTALITESGARAPFRPPIMFHLRFMHGSDLAEQYRARQGKEFKPEHLRMYKEQVSEQRPLVVLKRAFDWLAGIVAEGTGAAPPAGNGTAPADEKGPVRDVVSSGPLAQPSH